MKEKVPKYFTRKQNIWFAARIGSLILLGLFVLGVVLLYLNSAFGWFAMNEDVSGGGAGVKSTGQLTPGVHAWRFDIKPAGSQTPVETGEDFIKDGIWVDALDTATTDDANDIVSVALNTGTGEKYTFISLHLGTVDNLLDLSDDNCFYIRLDMTADVIGNRGAAVSASYAANSMKFYSSTGAEVSKATLDAKSAEIYNLLLGLVDIDCAVSATPYDMTTAAGATAVEALFETAAAANATVTLDTNYIQLARTGESTAVYAPSDDTPYYLYMRLRPDLATCFDATHDISEYMPCQILFNMQIEVGFGQ